MNSGFSTKKNPYQGIWVVALFLIAVPVGIFFWTRGIITRYTPQEGRALIAAEATVFAGLIGSLFSLFFVLKGGLRMYFLVTAARTADFFSNVGISFRCACRWWREDVRENGLAFLICVVLIALNAGVLVFGVLRFLALYSL